MAGVQEVGRELCLVEKNVDSCSDTGLLKKHLNNSVSQGSRSYSRSYSSSHYYHSGGGGGPLPTWAIILIVGVVVAIALCYLCYAISDDDEQ